MAVSARPEHSHKADEIHREFIDAVFHSEPPMSAPEQREAFEAAISETLEDSCSIDLVQFVHEQLMERIEQHKESKDPEPLTLTVREVGVILQDCGVTEERVASFCDKCSEQFGDHAVLNPDNLIDRKRFEIKTANATISVDPEHSYLVETRVINGRKYILILKFNKKL